MSKTYENAVRRARGDDGDLCTIEEAQNFLTCSRSTIYTLIKSGKINTVKFGRFTRVTQRSLDRFVAELTASASRDG